MEAVADRQGLARQMGPIHRGQGSDVFYTDTADAPWVIVKSDDKKRARINCMRHFLYELPYAGKNKKVVYAPDPLIVGFQPRDRPR